MAKAEAPSIGNILAANMTRLMAGCAVGVLRSRMKAQEIDIGTGTLHRAIKGEGGNRLESLEKIAAYFGVTTAQLLQPDLGHGADYGPFSRELKLAIEKLEPVAVAKLEAVMRAHLGIITTPPNGGTHLAAVASAPPTGTPEGVTEVTKKPDRSPKGTKKAA